jgi:hypothetical protein
MNRGDLHLSSSTFPSHAIGELTPDGKLSIERSAGARLFLLVNPSRLTHLALR